MDENAALRNFKDFLMIYNQMAELCFSRCVSSINGRDLLPEEEECVDKCAAKHININHKMMSIYMEVQPQMIQKRNEDLQKQISGQESQVSKPESVEAVTLDTEPERKLPTAAKIVTDDNGGSTGVGTETS